jgi:hypothetical protein
MDEFKGMELFMDSVGNRHPLKSLINVKIVGNKYTAFIWHESQTGSIYETTYQIDSLVYEQLKKYLDAKTIR